MISYEPLFRTMKERGISSYRLEKMGFSRATYYAIRSGQSVSTNTIDRLCHLLQCRVEDVMEHIVDLRVPLDVDVSYADNWAEAH